MKKPNTKKQVQPEKKPYKEAEYGDLLLYWLRRTIEVMAASHYHIERSEQFATGTGYRTYPPNL